MRFKWESDCGHEWSTVNGEKPHVCPECGASEYEAKTTIFPVPAMSRVKGSKFQPYPETSKWGQMANEILSREAQDNFLSR